jgi:uncharacterized protein (DUF2249 family)
MAPEGANDRVRVLDVREIDGPPFGAITAALDDLEPDERLRLVSAFEPEPLYDVLAERGFSHRTTRVSGTEWHVEIERE